VPALLNAKIDADLTIMPDSRPFLTTRTDHVSRKGVVKAEHTGGGDWQDRGKKGKTKFWRADGSARKPCLRTAIHQKNNDGKRELPHKGLKGYRMVTLRIRTRRNLRMGTLQPHFNQVRVKEVTQANERKCGATWTGGRKSPPSSAVRRVE